MSDLRTIASRVNRYMVTHDKEMNWLLITGGIVLILIAFLPKKYAGFKAFMIGYAILPLPY